MHRVGRTARRYVPVKSPSQNSQSNNSFISSSYILQHSPTNNSQSLPLSYLRSFFFVLLQCFHITTEDVLVRHYCFFFPVKLLMYNYCIHTTCLRSLFRCNHCFLMHPNMYRVCIKQSLLYYNYTNPLLI